jgi:uncharacterized membrane protein
LATVLHILPGGIFLLLAPLQFSSWVRSRFLQFHRWSGRLLVLAAMTAASTGLYFGLFLPFAGPGESVPITLFGGLLWYALWKAVVAIRGRQVVRHREWMIRAFALALAISTVRIVGAVLDLTLTPAGFGPRPMFVLAIWTGWVTTLGAAEIWIRYTRSHSRRMSDEDRNIDCPEHGSAAATLVCQHLAEGQGLGFHVGPDPDAPDALWPDAWCGACEEVLSEEGEWNDAAVAYADFRLFCSGCYQRVRLANWPRHDAAFAELVETSMAYLHARQNELEVHYRLGNYPRYDWHQDPAELVFSDQGSPRLLRTSVRRKHLHALGKLDVVLGERIPARIREVEDTPGQNLWRQPLSSEARLRLLGCRGSGRLGDDSGRRVSSQGEGRTARRTSAASRS